MSLKKWSYINLFVGASSLILILLSPVHYFFTVIGIMMLVIEIIMSHITCRCPNCDVFLNAGLIFEASRKESCCAKCGEVINTDKEVKL